MRRRGHEAAVRHRRVGANAQEIVRAVDVGHRRDQRRTVEMKGRREARARILRARAEAVAGAERVNETRPQQQGAVIVDDRVAQVDRDRVGAVAGAQRVEPRADDREGVLPAYRLELTLRCFSFRRTQTVGSWCTSAIATPLAQIKPCESGSSSSPRTETIRSPSSSSASPQLASQSVQPRKTVRRGPSWAHLRRVRRIRPIDASTRGHHAISVIGGRRLRSGLRASSPGFLTRINSIGL